MEKVRPWCGPPSDRGRLNNRTEYRQPSIDYSCISYPVVRRSGPCIRRTSGSTCQRTQRYSSHLRVCRGTTLGPADRPTCILLQNHACTYRHVEPIRTVRSWPDKQPHQHGKTASLRFTGRMLIPTPNLKPSFSANPSHCSLSFSSSALSTWFPRVLQLLLTRPMSVFTFYFFCFTLFSCRFRAVA